MISLKRTKQVLIGLWLVGVSVNAHGIEMNRRQTLIGGLMSAFSGVVPKPVAEAVVKAPVSVAAQVLNPSPIAVDPSLIDYRRLQIVSQPLYRAFAHPSFNRYPNEPWKGHMYSKDPGVADIIRDWAKQNRPPDPAVDSALTRYFQLLDEERPSHPLTPKESSEFMELEVFIEQRITQAPWSSMNWAEVFAGRVTAMEVELTQELGLDLGQLYMGITDVLRRDMPEIIRTYYKAPPTDVVPIYSREFIAAFCAKLAKFSPHVASYVAMYNSVDWRRDQDLWRLEVMRTLGMMHRTDTDPEYFKLLPLRYFRNNRFQYRSDQTLTPEKLATDYVRALSDLRTLRSIFEKFGDSIAREAIFVTVDLLQKDLTLELRTLPQRLKAQEELDQPQRHDNPKFPERTSPLWETYGSVDLETNALQALQWLQYLRVANAAVEGFETMLQPEPATKCENLLIAPPSEQPMSMEVNLEPETQSVEAR